MRESTTRVLLPCVALALVGELAGCRPRGNVTGAAPRASVDREEEPSTSAKPPELGAWLLEAQRSFDLNRGRRGEQGDLTFARVRFRLPRLSSAFSERHCPTPSDCGERTRYVRIRDGDGGLEFLPDCSALDEERLLDELTPLGPWKGASFPLEQGRDLHLVGPTGQRLGVTLEFVEPPKPATPDIWEEWLYARSLASAFAASQGFAAPLFGQEACTSDSCSSVCEAELATLGNPLAILGTNSTCPVGVAPVECLRRHVLLPVEIGHFQNFCGRTRMAGNGPAVADRGHAAELARGGLELPRLLAGAAWTAFGHRVPQTDVSLLSRAVQELGLRETLEPRFAAVAFSSDVSFRNRFRARFLLLSLDAPLDDAALLREFRALVRPCDATNPADCTGTPNEDQLDRTCIDHTLGFLDWACAHG